MRLFSSIAVLLLSTITLTAAAPVPQDIDLLVKRTPESDDSIHLVARAPTNVKMTGGAKAVLGKSGLTHADFGGKDPVQHHVDHVSSHIAKDTNLSKYPKAAITAPYHQGGTGGGGHPPDPRNHATVKLSGGGHTPQTIHVPAPHGAPSVASHHFGHTKREFEEESHLVARARKPKTGPTVYMTGGAKKVLKNSGLSHADFGGKNPVKAHVDHVKAHIAANPSLGKVKQAQITAPYHQGGRGGGGRGPDMSNHATVRIHAEGRRPQTIHVPAPASAPSVASHHFGHKRALDLEEEIDLF